MNRQMKTLFGVLVPPLLVFVLTLFILRIDIASTLLLTSVTLLVTLISARARRNQYPTLDAIDGKMEAELNALMKQGQTDMDQVLFVAKHVKSKPVADNAMELYRLGEKIMGYILLSDS